MGDMWGSGNIPETLIISGGLNDSHLPGPTRYGWQAVASLVSGASVLTNTPLARLGKKHIRLGALSNVETARAYSCPNGRTSSRIRVSSSMVCCLGSKNWLLTGCFPSVYLWLSQTICTWWYLDCWYACFFLRYEKWKMQKRGNKHVDEMWKGNDFTKQQLYDIVKEQSQTCFKIGVLAAIGWSTLGSFHVISICMYVCMYVYIYIYILCV